MRELIARPAPPVPADDAEARAGAYRVRRRAGALEWTADHYAEWFPLEPVGLEGALAAALLTTDAPSTDRRAA